MNVSKIISTRLGRCWSARPPHPAGSPNHARGGGRIHFRLGFGLGLTALALALALSQAGRGKTQPTTNQPDWQRVLSASATSVEQSDSGSLQTAPPQFAAGYLVHRDPRTGRFVASGDSIPMSGGTSNAFSTSDEGLTVVDSPVQGGGFMIHLQGRFQHGMTAQLNAQGRLVTDCQAAHEADSIHGTQTVRTDKE